MKLTQGRAGKMDAARTWRDRGLTDSLSSGLRISPAGGSVRPPQGARNGVANGRGKVRL